MGAGVRVRRMRETDGSETNFVPLWADHLNSQLNLNSQYRDALRAQRAQVAALARWRSPLRQLGCGQSSGLDQLLENKLPHTKNKNNHKLDLL